jgi:hypothetical protein
MIIVVVIVITAIKFNSIIYHFRAESTAARPAQI